MVALWLILGLAVGAGVVWALMRTRIRVLAGEVEHERALSQERLASFQAAEDIIEDARGREREIRLGAEDYADEILNTLEVNLSKFIAAVQRGRDRLAGKDEPAEVA